MKRIDHSTGLDIYTSIDKDKSLYNAILPELLSYGSLPRCIYNICRHVIIDDEERTEISLFPKLIALAECINIGFGNLEFIKRLATDTIFNFLTEDQLFEVILTGIYHGVINQFEYYNIDDKEAERIMKRIDKFYDVELS